MLRRSTQLRPFLTLVRGSSLKLLETWISHIGLLLNWPFSFEKLKLATEVRHWQPYYAYFFFLVRCSIGVWIIAHTVQRGVFVHFVYGIFLNCSTSNDFSTTSNNTAWRMLEYNTYAIARKRVSLILLPYSVHVEICQRMLLQFVCRMCYFRLYTVKWSTMSITARGWYDLNVGTGSLAAFNRPTINTQRHGYRTFKGSMNQGLRLTGNQGHSEGKISPTLSLCTTRSLIAQTHLATTTV